MKKVYIQKINDYNINSIIEFFYKCFPCDELKFGYKVLIKPNLLGFKSPEKCVNTHPIFFEAVVKFLKEFNVKIFVGDSPGFGTLNRNLKMSKYLGVIEKYDVKIYNFTKKIEIERNENKILKRFKISDAIKNFDYIINLPKLKTHSMMGLTLSVKNCYGFIVGKDKISYHLKAGYNKIFFADILIDICETVKPNINILDGIWGMEGNGPSGGSPINLGIVGLSKCPYSLDFVIEKIVKYGNSIITLQAKKRKVLNTKEIKEIYLNEVSDVKLRKSKVKPANFHIPKFLSNLIYPAPKIIYEKCIKCYTCLKNCPPKAIYEKNGHLSINKKQCIRCYCCHELCMYGAIKL